ncbi:hypothetical protein VC83_09644 [Pseudogymnoascus destructans]|uniref:CCHC-type domain-containing protein n=1 Tax=Pseudogymnoascus destructans TaxID=655981 RepID=A0A2P6FGL1_9PEZI|nr:uncharacterized protein VC83_09644 [Pseudogymnoascus destructans]PQM43517.1 hypothetical protein VC83_09644 [Pseudogymnoascus destructans]
MASQEKRITRATSGGATPAAETIEASPPTLGPEASSSATSKADRMPSKLAALKNRIEEERAYYNTMEEALQVFRRSHGDDYSAYPEEVRVFAERQVRIQEEGRRKRRHQDSEEEWEGTPNEEEQETASVVSREATPSYRPFGKVKDPKVYKGESTRELNEFMASIRASFRYQPRMFPTEQSKVAFAAQYLESDPMKEWDNRCASQEEGLEDPLDIAGFEEFLRDLHIDPANRQRIAALKYNGAHQRKGQGIRKFVAYLEELEREMEPYTESQRTTHLLTKLHPEMRQRLLEGGYAERSTTHREAVVNILAMLEMNNRWVTEKNPSTDRPNTRENKGTLQGGFPARKGHFNSHKSGNHRERTPFQDRRRSDQQPARKPADTQGARPTQVGNACYNCGRPGHFAKDCRSQHTGPGVRKLDTQLLKRE